MNDFTKDELIKLKNGIEYLPQSVNLSKQYLQDCQAIITKIKSMIDNYCEHKSKNEALHAMLERLEELK